MATVPGTPIDMNAATGGIPHELQPGYPELLMAAAMHQQGAFKMAGDVLPFPKRSPLSPQPGQSTEQYGQEQKKIQTRDVLSRALGGTQNVLPLTPKSGD